MPVTGSISYSVIVDQVFTASVLIDQGPYRLSCPRSTKSDSLKLSQVKKSVVFFWQGQINTFRDLTII